MSSSPEQSVPLLPLKPQEEAYQDPDKVTGVTDVDFDTLSDDELATIYERFVGINPKNRFFDRETMVTGVKDPKAEKERIRKIDAEDDGIGDPWNGK